MCSPRLTDDGRLESSHSAAELAEKLGGERAFLQDPMRQRPPWSAPRGMRGGVADTRCASIACEQRKPKTMTDDGSLYRIDGR